MSSPWPLNRASSRNRTCFGFSPLRARVISRFVPTGLPPNIEPYSRTAVRSFSSAIAGEIVEGDSVPFVVEAAILVGTASAPRSAGPAPTTEVGVPVSDADEVGGDTTGGAAGTAATLPVGEVTGADRAVTDCVLRSD